MEFVIGDVINVTLTVSAKKPFVDQQARRAKIIGLRNVVGCPVQKKAKYKNVERIRSGEWLIACEDLDTQKKFSFYDVNAVSIVKG